MDKMAPALGVNGTCFERMGDWMKPQNRCFRQIFVIAGLALSPLLASQSALAQDENVVQEADREEFQKKTIIDFSDVNIEGELTKPEGSYIKNRKSTKFRNLIQLRGNFRPELSRSVEAL
jgi:hypothetical protein